MVVSVDAGEGRKAGEPIDKFIDGRVGKLSVAEKGYAVFAGEEDVFWGSRGCSAGSWRRKGNYVVAREAEGFALAFGCGDGSVFRLVPSDAPRKCLSVVEGKLRVEAGSGALAERWVDCGGVFSSITNGLCLDVQGAIDAGKEVKWSLATDFPGSHLAFDVAKDGTVSIRGHADLTLGVAKSGAITLVRRGEGPVWRAVGEFDWVSPRAV